MRVIVEYDVTVDLDLGQEVSPDEIQRRREVYVRAELHAPFGWTVENVQVTP